MILIISTALHNILRRYKISFPLEHFMKVRGSPLHSLEDSLLTLTLLVNSGDYPDYQGSYSSQYETLRCMK